MLGDNAAFHFISTETLSSSELLGPSKELQYM